MLEFVDVYGSEGVNGKIVLMVVLKISLNETEELSVWNLSLKEVVSFLLNLSLINIFVCIVCEGVSHLELPQL